MSNGNRYSGAHLLLAFLAGAATGAVAALLNAPSSGREARDNVREWARGAQGKATLVPGALREAADRAMQAAKIAFNEALEETKADEETREPS